MNDEILYHNDPAVQLKIDSILFDMAKIFANVGKDSTFAEHQHALRREQDLMDKIKKLDPGFEKRIRPYGKRYH
jgi:hypothetical protein